MNLETQRMFRNGLRKPTNIDLSADQMEQKALQRASKIHKNLAK
jgi:hypothetical protein